MLVNAATMFGAGNLPKFGDQLYHCPIDDLYLVPTAESPLTTIHRDEVLDERKLPMRYAAYTPCFRREAGAAGAHERGKPAFTRTNPGRGLYPRKQNDNKQGR